MTINVAKQLKLLETPSYVIDEDRLTENLEILREVAARAGCKILLAQKAYSAFATYPLIARYLSGTTASGLYEARLGREYMPGSETHVFSPAYLESEIEEIVSVCDHVIFNSFEQWQWYKPAVLGKTSPGLRINPECPTGSHSLYDPCAAFSRMGVTLANFKPGLLSGLDGFHIHTLCEQNADALEQTLAAFLPVFGEYLHGLKWLNLGGGHHITREDYDRELLIKLVRDIRKNYNVDVYLEPGEAVALNAGYLVTTVLDVVTNGIPIAILDASAACHMPDVIEMPYKPNVLLLRGDKIYKGEEPTAETERVRLAGNTCLAGDIIGDYTFGGGITPRSGDKLIFLDMAIYSFVKNNTFNGMKLPSIAILRGNKTPGTKVEVIKSFGYEEFKSRLGG